MKFPSFKKKPTKAVKLELLSVHIPKTAGTSFRQFLKDTYGTNAVVRVDLPLLDARLRINNELVPKPVLPYGTRVVHGHFNPTSIQQLFPETKGIPMITWLRHPVDRVISNYYYLKKRLTEELDEENNNLNILSKMQRSLMEYARDDINRNRQAKFLKGSTLDTFAFVGIQEYYDSEIKQMTKEFHWATETLVPKHNITGNKPSISEEERAEIARLNKEDIALYEAALELREKRLTNPKIELISIHIPKTGGTSFYNSLLTAYGNDVSFPYRRNKLRRSLERYSSLLTSLNGNKRVLHGHLYYSEVADIHRDQAAKVICWLRDPVLRVISNYHFFKAGLTDPSRNQRNYKLNKHRKKESLITYARRDENKNVMSKFLKGIELEDLFFIGFLENYTADLHRLGQLLGWSKTEPARLNVSKKIAQAADIDSQLYEEIKLLNAIDISLYNRALQLNKANERI